MANIKVWDPLVRISHWTLLALFIVSYISGEEEHPIHIISGYGIFILITIRIIWGFIGSRHARFTNFVRSPKTVLHYLNSMRSGKPDHYMGHNPAGGLMILALLTTLFITTLSGVKLYGIEEGKGPFAVTTATEHAPQTGGDSYHETEDNEHHHGAYSEEEDDDHSYHEYDDDEYGYHEAHEEAEEFWEEIHESAVNFMLLLILLHVIGVVISSRLHGESLAKAMITGNKTEP